jgi:outer membrane protein assembly factor BamB
VNARFTESLIPTAIAVLGAAVIGLWLTTGTPQDLPLRLAGLDQPAEAGARGKEPASAPVAGAPQAGPGAPSAVAGTWPWFRGPARDAISRDPVRLARSWPPEGPPVLWTVTLGEGYAGAAVDAGRVYVLDYDELAGADTLRCLSFDDGREIWHNSHPVAVMRNHGMSRTVPAILGDAVVTIGPRCHVACWDANTGACRWLIDLELTYGTVVPRWYTGQCPLIDQGRLILAPGGPDALLLAVDIATGEPLWQTPNPLRRTMTHASVVPLEHLGQRMYVYCASSAVVGVSADDGRELWQSTEWTEQFATSPSPVVLPDGRLFLSSGYGNKVGSLVLQLLPGPDGIVAQKVLELTPRQFNSEQHTPVLYDGHLLGVRKHGGGPLVCLDLEGREIWTSGKDRFGHGPYLVADDLLLAMGNDGELVMAEANTTAYRPLARHRVFADGHDAWAPMACVAGRLIVRDMTRMVCLDLAAREGG